MVTPNVDHAINLGEDDRYAKVYERAVLRLIDGAPLLWLARLIGFKNVQKFSGSDLIGICASVALARGWRVVLIGGDSDLCKLALDRLQASHAYADDTFAALPVPFLSTPDAPASRRTIEELTTLVPSIVFVCLGSPKQELWFEAWAAHLPPAVYVGAGATIEFVAGTKKRAPRIIQILGLEWTWRLALEPHRLWRRYLVKGPRFLPIVVRSLLERNVK